MTTYVKNSGEWKMPTKTFLKQNQAWNQIDGSRYVANFNGTTQYGTAPAVSEIDLDDPNLEFEIEWTGVCTGTGIDLILQDSQFDSTAVDYKIMLWWDNNSLNLRVGSTGSLTFNGLDKEALNTYSITVNKTTISLSVNGVEIESQPALPMANSAWVENSVLYIATSSYNSTISNFYKGQLSNIKIWTGGDRNTGTLTRHYRMDEGWRGANNQVLVNYATELGEELVVNGEFAENLDGWTFSFATTPPVWVDGGGARFPYNDDVQCRQNIGDYTTNKLVHIEYELLDDGNPLNPQSFTIYFEGGATFQGVQNDFGNGSISAVGVPISNTNIVTVGYGNETIISKISIKQADGYGTYVGLTEASWTEETV